MQNLDTFLYVIGVYNIVGAIVMYAILHEAIGPKMMTICETFSTPYQINKEGTLWLWWAATLNMLYGAANVAAATRWDAIAKIDVLLANIALYAFFIVLSFFALSSKTYSRGIWTNFPLFGFWLGWAIYVYSNN